MFTKNDKHLAALHTIEERYGEHTFYNWADLLKRYPPSPNGVVFLLASNMQKYFPYFRDDMPPAGRQYINDSYLAMLNLLGDYPGNVIDGWSEIWVHLWQSFFHDGKPTDTYYCTSKAVKNLFCKRIVEDPRLSAAMCTRAMENQNKYKRLDVLAVMVQFLYTDEQKVCVGLLVDDDCINN